MHFHICDCIAYIYINVNLYILTLIYEEGNGMEHENHCTYTMLLEDTSSKIFSKH